MSPQPCHALPRCPHLSAPRCIAQGGSGAEGWHGAAQHRAAQHGVGQGGTRWQGTVWGGRGWHGVAGHNAAWHGVAGHRAAWQAPRSVCVKWHLRTQQPQQPRMGEPHRWLRVPPAPCWAGGCPAGLLLLSGGSGGPTGARRARPPSPARCPAASAAAAVPVAAARPYGHSRRLVKIANAAAPQAGGECRSAPAAGKGISRAWGGVPGPPSCVGLVGAGGAAS